MTPSYAPASPRTAGRARLLLGAALLAATACGLPTELPQVDQQWSVPSQTRAISVGSLLPTAVRILPDSSAFTMDFLSVLTVFRPLRADCSACADSNGRTVPKPAFTATFSVINALPSGADLVSARLVSGAIQLTIQNENTFDPLRPGATARGRAIVTITNGSVIFGRDSIDGATTALPAGGTLTRTIALSPGVILGADPLTATVRIESPAGDPVVMDANRRILVTASPTGLRFSSADINVTGRALSSVTFLNLQDVDAAIISHVTGGMLGLEFTNPFNVAGTITVGLTAAGQAPFVHTVSLAPGLTATSIPLSQDELRALLGNAVTLSVSGPVTGTNGPITVTPRAAVGITSRLELTLHTGG